MKYLFIAIFTVFSSNILLNAQEKTKSDIIDEDKKKYEESVFSKEHDEYQDTIDFKRKQYDRIPEKLPEWVFTSTEFGSTSSIIGISDPNMEKGKAIAQAILRAKAMYALFNYSAISNISDDYTSLLESGKYSLFTTKFQDFSLSKARITYNDSAISVVDTFFTKYDEVLVLLEFKHSLDSIENRDTLEIKGEQLQIFTEKNFKKEKIEFFNFSIHDYLHKNDSVDFTAKYNYRIVNRGYEINSVFNDSVIAFEDRTYNYRTDLDFVKDSTDFEFNFFRLRRGLWNAYITGVLNNITILSKQLASHVKNSNDYYTLKSEGLVRTVARNKIVFDFKKFTLHENQLYIELNAQIRY